MKIAIVGAGAMGTLFGGRLARAGHAVTMVDADPARVAAINAHGLVEHSARGGSVRVPAARAADLALAADLILMFTKSLHTAAAIRDAAPLLAPDGQVLTLQNGLGNDATIADVVGSGRVLAGMTTWPADLVEHGHVHVLGEGRIRIWSMTGEARPGISGVAAALDEAGLGCAADAGVRGAIWEKVIFNAALNGTAALTGMTVGQMADYPPARALVDRVVEEGICVAGAAGIAIDPAGLRATVADALASHGGHKPSMLQDVEAGRPTEVEAILGSLTAEAARRHVAVPHLATCAALIRSIDHRRHGGSNARNGST